MTVFFVFFVVLAFVRVQDVLSCICMPMHPQQQYCRAQYAISGRVTSSEWRQIELDIHNDTDPFHGQSPEDIAWGKELVTVQKNFTIPRFELHNWEIAYTVKVRQVFKSPDDDPIAVGQNLVLRSRPQHRHLCGISLQNRKNYVLAGPVLGHIQLCDWVQLYETITRRQKQGLRRGYKKHCNACQVFSCDPEFCNPPPGNNICVYAGEMHSKDAIEWENSDCIARHSRCQQKGRGRRCRWQNNGDTGQCHSRYGIQKWFNTRNFLG